MPSYPPAANPLLDAKVAYFSMEIHIEDDIPTYSGGLGVLAGDTVRAAADLGIPLVGVTLVHRLGYVKQHLDAERGQTEEPEPWSPETRLVELDARARVEVRGRTVELRGFRYDVRGTKGSSVSVILLDADLPSNDPADRRLTDRLYGGDAEYRLAQEIILGIGGVRFLRALGCASVERFHMNEGHAALLSLELLDKQVERRGGSVADAADVEAVRRQCVFTTHTPVAAGHDQFPLELALAVVGREELGRMPAGFSHEGMLNMTYLALHLSHYVNGVAKRHGEVSRHLLGEYRIEAITNGVHAATWASPPFLALYDRFLEGWRSDNF